MTSCYGRLILWHINYAQSLFNDNMEPVSQEEQQHIEYIFQHRDEFKDLFRLGRKIECKINIIERTIKDDLGILGVSIWEYGSSEQLAEDLRLEVEEKEIIADTEELEELLDEVRNGFNDLIALLDQLTELEDKYIRQR